ncbi:unnamed protein product [Nyctereutes procyonoides]|uniref:Translationally-controlled tumor protein n=1 Tax=Nyctereutes procyonoides TaxID=34880 RepID=A0A811YIV7_NYCPR|nr:unnamed protein product [Nyctereutes procyonoides]
MESLPSSLSNSGHDHYLYLISHDGWLCLEVKGKMVSRTEGNTDNSFIDENASTEGPEGKGTKTTIVTGYIKDYMESIKGKLEEQRPDRVKSFVAGVAGRITYILADFKKL